LGQGQEWIGTAGAACRGLVGFGRVRQVGRGADWLGWFWRGRRGRHGADGADGFGKVCLGTAGRASLGWLGLVGFGRHGGDGHGKFWLVEAGAAGLVGQAKARWGWGRFGLAGNFKRI